MVLNMIAILCFALAGLIPLTSATKVNRLCTSYTSQGVSVHLESLNGTWYEISGYDDVGKCNHEELTYAKKSGSLSLVHKGESKDKNIDGSVELLDKTTNTLNITSKGKEYDVTVLGVDAKKYAVLWYCEDNEDKKSSTQSLLILSRTKTTYEKLKEAADVLNKTTILKDKIKLHHSKCESSAETIALSLATLAVAAFVRFI